MPQTTFRHLLALAGTAVLAMVSATCTGPTKPGPVVVDLIIQAVTPSSGPATGGTDVTIRGTGFGAGASVMVGGRPATDIVVRGTDTITAKTPTSVVSGAVDISVSLNGRTVTLPGAFRYEIVSNTAPIIKSVTAQGTRTRQPANFADYGETIRITAVVEDAQTPAAQLKYDWTDRCGGTFSGTGAQVSWSAPVSLGLPQNCAIELIVSDGPRLAASSVTVRLHNSVIEIRALALEFLTEFADSTIPAATVVRNFSDSCKGKADELAQIETNRRDYRILSHTYGEPSVTIGFGGVCPFRSRSADGCFRMPAGWTSTKLIDGSVEVVTGVSHVTAVYRNAQWRLCDSDYGSTSTVAGSTFID